MALWWCDRNIVLITLIDRLVTRIDLKVEKQLRQQYKRVLAACLYTLHLITTTYLNMNTYYIPRWTSLKKGGWIISQDVMNIIREPGAFIQKVQNLFTLE